MVFRTKTSKKTMEIYEEIKKREGLQPFALAKVSIALAIHAGYTFEGELDDSNGLDLNRQTITGDNDLLYKKLIEMNEGKSIPEEEYFPNYVKAYMDHGAILLEQECKYANKNDMYCHLVNVDEGI